LVLLNHLTVPTGIAHSQVRLHRAASRGASHCLQE